MNLSANSPTPSLPTQKNQRWTYWNLRCTQLKYLKLFNRQNPNLLYTLMTEISLQIEITGISLKICIIKEDSRNKSKLDSKVHFFSSQSLRVEFKKEKLQV